MVSGFLISPKDHERIRSGEAKETLISSNVFAGVSGLNGLFVSSWFIFNSLNWGALKGGGSKG
jgi:hypothetical protein